MAARAVFTAGASLLALVEGGSGNDSLPGTGGDDEIFGGAGNDTLDGGAGTDAAVYRFDDLSAGISFDASSLNPGSATSLADGRGGTDTLLGIEYIVVRGGGFADTLTGSTGNDQLAGGNGNDGLFGNVGADLLQGNDGNDSLYGGSGADVLFGDAGDDQLRGEAGSDVIVGGSGNDYITGGDGNDTLDGGEGDTDWADYLYTNQSTGIVASLVTGVVTGGGGTDLLRGIEDVNGTDFADRIVGDGGSNMILGNGGNDTLESGGGNDRWLYGGDGNDSLVGGNGNQAMGGGTGDDVLTGGNGGDYMRGEAGNDTIDGGGNTTDSFFRDLAGYNDYAATGAVLVDLALGTAVMGSDTDTLINLQGAIGTDAFADTLRGAAVSDFLAGRGGNDLLEGRGGDDFLAGDTGNDTLDGGANGPDGDYADYYDASGAVTVNLLTNTGGSATMGTDTYIGIENATGGAFNDRLTGNDLANILVGNAGNDTLTGNGGNDILLGRAGVDVLDGGAGIDLVSFKDDVSNAGGFVVYLGSAGYAVDDTQIDTLRNIESAYGSTGNDTLHGDGGANWLGGQLGNDWLDGAGGADTLVGGDGNDTYVVNSAADVVSEVGTGTDTVRSSIDFTLGANLERLTLTGSAAINGTGNALANLLVGNAVANVLNGGTGSDTLMGGLGNDTYIVDSTGDRINEGGIADIDTVQSGIAWTLGDRLENLTLTGTGAIAGTGNALANVLTGNSGANTLSGGSGNDTLDGKTGQDRLVGGDGLDSFRFSTAPAAANADRIADFVSADDRILLDDAVFTAIGPSGALSAAAYRAGAAATDASDRVIYDAATGQLFYDTDGNGAGAAVLFATVTAGTSIALADFVIV